ncbi:MAG TPA: hypothetical protein VL357_06430 [Rariglobus sp.]|jgi:hypothetical protein|nr:hypothetical protein [Rariglobus sp.]
MNKAFRYYTVGLIGVIVLFLMVGLALNIVVNPWRVLPARWMAQSLEPYRDTSEALRTSKAGLVRAHPDCEVIFAGSSRINIGLNPEHPALAGSKTLNLAFSGGLILETAPMVRYALAHEKNLKLVIVGIDPGDLVSNRDLRRVTDFYSSPLADEGFSLDRELRYWIGMPVLKASISTLRNALHGESSPNAPLGQSLLPRIPPDLRAYVKNQRQDFIFETSEAWALEPKESSIGKVDALRSLLSDLRKAGVKALVVFPPMHALRLVNPSDDYPEHVAWERDRRILAQVCGEVNGLPETGPAVQLWDFMNFAPPMDEPLPAANAPGKGFPDWFDLVHFSARVGDRMLDRMLGPDEGAAPTDGFGVDVLKEGIEAHLAAIRESHRKYCASHPEDVAWMRSILNAKR